MTTTQEEIDVEFLKEALHDALDLVRKLLVEVDPTYGTHNTYLNQYRELLERTGG
jgi:hypothetical protein